MNIYGFWLLLLCPFPTLLGSNIGTSISFIHNFKYQKQVSSGLTYNCIYRVNIANGGQEVKKMKIYATVVRWIGT